MKGRTMFLGALALSAVIAGLLALRMSKGDTRELVEAGTGGHRP